MSERNLFKNPESILESKEKRPRYRYFYHGGLKQSLPEIETSGFKFKEYTPNITNSPLYGIRFIEKEINKGGGQVKKRKKYSDNKSDEATEDDGVLYVIEPMENYQAYSSTTGAPNFFSSPDQIPEDIDEKVFFRGGWTNYQKHLAKEPLANVSKELKHPGLCLNKKRTNEGWVPVEDKDKLDKPGTMPAESVKMVIEKNSEFRNIFEDINKDLSNGDFNQEQYISRLIVFFKKGENIIKNQVEDLEALAQNMVMGELEHYLVTKVRKLYLDIESYKGKTLIKNEAKPQNKIITNSRSKEAILTDIENLKKIDLDNEIFKRYVNIFINKFESELH